MKKNPPKPMTKTKGSYLPSSNMVFPPTPPCPPPKEIIENQVEYKIKTSINFKKEIIEQELISPGQMTQTIKWVINTREKAVEEALIKLGWTPPQK